MRCPRCAALVPDGTAICTNCDEILDTSFPGQPDGDETPLTGDPTELGARPTRERPGARRRGGWNEGHGEDSAPRAPAAPKGSYLAEEAAPEEVDPLLEARRSVDELGSFYRALAPGDRWSSGGALALLVSLALPWRWTKADDEVIGLVAAWPVAALGAAVAGLVYWRTRRATVQLGRTLLLAQAAAAVAATVFCGWFLRAVADVRTVRAAGRLVTTTLSAAEPGAYVGIVCAAVAAVATLASLGGRRE